MKLCSPALLYLVVSIITLLLMIVVKFNALSIIYKLIFIAFWTYILNFICSKGYNNISWILVLLPYLFILLMFAMFSTGLGNSQSQQQQPSQQQQQNGSNQQIPTSNMMLVDNYSSLNQ
jgi:high-affinity K+ transport system ATPase subunit B